MLQNIFKTIKSDFPDITFLEGDIFAWSPHNSTITYQKITSQDQLLRLLHEIAHAQLGHHQYNRDIELIEMETGAWHYAVNSLAPRYKITVDINDEQIQADLDSYRDWLHKRSTCPKCSAVGIQSDQYEYRCLNCQAIWRVNEARSCQLKRYKK